MDEAELIEREIDRALRPYRDLLPQEALDELENLLREFISCHPSAHDMLRRIVPRHVPQTSEETPTTSDASGSDVDPEKRSAG